jgi:hypothetical protein
LPLLLGNPRLQPWVSQPFPPSGGFSPWGMPSRPLRLHPRAKLTAPPAKAKLSSIPSTPS